MSATGLQMSPHLEIGSMIEIACASVIEVARTQW